MHLILTLISVSLRTHILEGTLLIDYFRLDLNELTAEISGDFNQWWNLHK